METVDAKVQLFFILTMFFGIKFTLKVHVFLKFSTAYGGVSDFVVILQAENKPTMDGPNTNEVLCNLVGFFHLSLTSTLFTLY